MKEVIADLHQLTLKAAKVVTSKEKFDGLSEEDTDTLAEVIEILNDLYEVLYDKVFVKLDD
jgi:hypothetical protein